jgi:hypothetical protein
MGMDILMELFGRFLEGGLHVLLRKRGRGIEVPRCPHCGSPSLRRWAPAVDAIAYGLGVAVAYIAIAIGFWWVVLFVGTAVTGNLHASNLGIYLGGLALILLLTFIGGVLSIRYRRFPPKRCRQCGTSWTKTGQMAPKSRPSEHP